MEQKDVIVSAFAVPPKRADRQIAMPFEDWPDAPEVVGVDADYTKGATSDAAGFAQAAENYRDSDGYILRRLLRQRLADVQVRRIALVGFSAGGTFLSKVLQGPDAEHIDVVVVLDGMHIQKVYGGNFHGPSLSPWANFGVRAARGAIDGMGPLMVVTHTHIKQDAAREALVGNTNDSALAVLNTVVANAPDAPRMGYDPGLLIAPPPPPAVTITVNRPISPAESVPITRTWEAMPEPDIRGKGNFYVLDYGGDNEADHVFQARYVQGAAWRTFVGPRWQAPFACPPTESEAGGDTGQCAGAGVFAPPGLYQTSEGSHWAWALAGLAVGTGLGYLAGLAVEPHQERRRYA